MKLFMMPQTVPNRPTKGEVAPMVASSPMPSRMRRASAREISAKLEAARSLMPLSRGDAGRQPRLAHRGAQGTPTARRSSIASANCASASERDSAIWPERPAQLALHHRQFDHLGDEDGPGHERGEGKPDHDRFDDHVGRQEHRPWRQIVRHRRWSTSAIWRFATGVRRSCGRRRRGRLQPLAGAAELLRGGAACARQPARMALPRGRRSLGIQIRHRLRRRRGILLREAGGRRRTKRERQSTT